MSPIKLEELEQVLKVMANKNVLGPDGIIIEFLRSFWKVISLDDHRIICQSLASWMFSISIICGLIMPLYKRDDRSPLGNNQPITLMNSTYKIYAKFYQRRLQLVLVEVASPNQIAFLPMRCILDNIVLIHETINQAKVSKKSLLILQLDIFKAHN